MVARYRERSDGWPVGPCMTHGRAWSCTSPTVQLIEVARRGQQRFVVLTLFPFQRVDLRHPPSPRMSLHRARCFAYARLRELAGDQEFRSGGSAGIDWSRGGDHLAFEVRL